MIKPLVSLCIPTNGVVEWIIPVLDSIYSNNLDERLFEVVITDNGAANDLEERIKNYRVHHKNIVYKKTEAVQFYNQIECFKLATGMLVKFVNHRFAILDGCIEKLLKYAKIYGTYESTERPVLFFSNGMLHNRDTITIVGSFDSFVGELSEWLTWSTGLAFWNEDFKNMTFSKPFNKFFPHLDIIFSNADKKKYIVDDTIIFKDPAIGHEGKGKYNLFEAFAVEFPGMIFELYRENKISQMTYLIVRNKTLSYISRLYIEFIVMKKKCSYDLSDYSNKVDMFYSIGLIRRQAFREILKMIRNKLPI